MPVLASKVVAASFLIAFSAALPALLVGGIAIARQRSRRIVVDRVVALALVVAATPMSFFVTAYFFLGLPLVFVVSLVSGVLARSRRIITLIETLFVASWALWWIIAGGWAASCPTCGTGDGSRQYVWFATGMILASPLSLLLLTIEFGRWFWGRIFWDSKVDPPVQIELEVTS